MRSQLQTLAALVVAVILSQPQSADALDFGGSISLFATTVTNNAVAPQ